MQAKTDTFLNNIDPDETAHYEPSRQDLHWLPFFVKLCLTLCTNGRVQLKKPEKATSEMQE